VSRTDNADGTVNHYNVPDMNTEAWIHSRPRKHASNIADRAKTCGGMFLPLIRTIKEWNRAHSELMTSYHLEAVALKVCTIKVDDYPWSIYQFFADAVPVVAESLWYEDAYPDEYLDQETRQKLLKR